MKSSRVVLAIVVLAWSTSMIAIENPETVTERAHAKALDIVNAAADALGGEAALREIENVTIKATSSQTPRMQMPTVAGNGPAGSLDETVVLDLTKGRMRVEQKNKGQGFQGWNIIAMDGTDGVNIDRLAKTATPIPAAQVTQQQFIQFQRRLPNLIVRTALDRANTLRYLGEDTFEGRKHDVVSLVHADGIQMSLYFDQKSKLLSKYELIYQDAITGDDVSEICYVGYKPLGKTKVPSGWNWFQSGQKVAEFRYDVSFNQTLSDDTFKPSTEGLTKVAAANPNPPASMEKLADNVYLVMNVNGPNQHSLAVGFKDYVLVVEAPGTPAGSDAAIKKIKEAFPDKPIKYLATTHHHGDHIGGIRSYIADGVTIVTTPGNQHLIEQVAAAPLKDRLGRNPKKAIIETITNKKRVFDDGETQVELVDFGSPHAQEMVVAYLPKQKLVFQGDLFFLPLNDGPVAPQETFYAFQDKLKENKWDVEKIAGVHGRVATVQEFNATLKTDRKSVTGGQ